MLAVVLAARHHIGIQRVFFVGVIALIASTAGLAWTASDGTIILYQLGDWAAPVRDCVGRGYTVDIDGLDDSDARCLCCLLDRVWMG
jgi:hypothetical protein